MEWAKFFAMFLFVWSGLVLLFYAGIFAIRHWSEKRRDRAIQARLERRVF